MTNGPPLDSTPVDLWLQLQQMPRPFRVVDFPRKGPDGKPVGQIAIWPLTQNEHLAAGIAAEKLIRAELKEAKKDDIGYEAAYSNAACVEMLVRACRDVNDISKPAFPSAKSIREVLTVDETGVLFEHYLDISGQVGPIIAMMSKEECDAWVDRLLEGGSSVDPLGSFGRGALRALLRCAVDRLRKSPTASSSSGLPQESTQPDTLDMGDAPEGGL